jgi:rfaE bifunctional protein kinase chain/domain
MNRKRFLDLLEQLRSRRVAVVGDYLLDQYILGTTSRVSREAPIPVIDYQQSAHHPGGAANAAQNVTALGAIAVAVGVLGDDSEGATLSELLRGRGVDTHALLLAPGEATSTKLRIMAGEMNAQKQQVARVDRSHRVALAGDLAARLLTAISGAVASSDAVLLADYGLGVLSPPIVEHAIARARERKIPIVVDSRYRLAWFRGATVAVPNEVEAMEALGIEREADLVNADAMQRRVADCGLEGIIVTRGSLGMIVCDARGAFETIGIAGSREATDVTGAGDTVAAMVALALAAGGTLAEAAHMATFAASVVVMKRGTATTSPDEVRAAIAASDGAGEHV